MKIHQKTSIGDISRIIEKELPQRIVLGSVHFPLQQFRQTLGSIPVYGIHSGIPVPFKINYRTPETLGIDRLAGIACAWERFPGKNTLVIDAGTCITYDFISAQGVYSGGGISPGIDIRFKSLQDYTANLPLVELSGNISLIGDSTKNSILSGVYYGMLAEIEGIIERYKSEFSDLTIFMSGGSSIFFESKIKHSIFAFPNMVLLGLYSIYEFNYGKH